MLDSFHRWAQSFFQKTVVFWKAFASIAIVSVITFAVVEAGSITPPVGTPAATFYTLTDLYNLVNSNTTTTEGGHDFTFASNLEGTGYTLTQLYNALTGLINPARVLSGTTYLGVAGTYNATNLSTTTVKSGVEFGVGLTGAYTASVSGFPGTGWSGSGLTEAACESASGWYWFEDANGDGDTTDPDDGICVKEATISGNSWNGSEQMAAFGDLNAQTATGGSTSTLVKTGAGWTVNTYVNSAIKITSGTASGCWGIVKSNTSDTVTVYGSWLTTSRALNCGTPDATSVFTINDRGFADHDPSWIGDWSCSGSFPNGTVSWGSFPTSAQVGAETNIALAVTDCYDGQRDLLPTEADRMVATGTATAADATSITDTNLVMFPNFWVGQKVLITGGTGSGGSARIESHTTTTITVASWTGGTPDVGSTFGVVYVIPHAIDNGATDVDGDDDDEVGGDNGPLNRLALRDWKGTRLPTMEDFYGFCGHKDGGSNYENTTSTFSGVKAYGNWGTMVGRTDEFIDLASVAPSVGEWLSDMTSGQDPNVLVAQGLGSGTASGCSGFSASFPISANERFRAVFRP